MQFLTNYQLNEDISAAQSNDVARTLTEEGLFPPEGAEIINWVGTPDGWGVSLWEADDNETIHKGLNMWRVAAEEAAFFETTKTAPTAPVQEVMNDRIELLERNFEEESIPGGNDLAFLGNIVHGIDPDGNKSLFEKIAEATTDAGVLAILDQIPAERGGLRARVDPTNTNFTQGVSALVGFNLFPCSVAVEFINSHGCESGSLTLDFPTFHTTGSGNLPGCRWW